MSYKISGVNGCSPILSILVGDLVNKPKLLYFIPSIPWIIGFDVSIDSIKGKPAY